MQEERGESAAPDNETGIEKDTDQDPNVSPPLEQPPKALTRLAQKCLAELTHIATNYGFIAIEDPSEFHRILQHRATGEKLEIIMEAPT